MGCAVASAKLARRRLGRGQRLAGLERSIFWLFGRAHAVAGLLATAGPAAGWTGSRGLRLAACAHPRLFSWAGGLVRHPGNRADTLAAAGTATAAGPGPAAVHPRRFDWRRQNR